MYEWVIYESFMTKISTFTIHVRCCSYVTFSVPSKDPSPLWIQLKTSCPSVIYLLLLFKIRLPCRVRFYTSTLYYIIHVIEVFYIRYTRMVFLSIVLLTTDSLSVLVLSKFVFLKTLFFVQWVDVSRFYSLYVGVWKFLQTLLEGKLYSSSFLTSFSFFLHRLKLPKKRAFKQIHGISIYDLYSRSSLRIKRF